MIKLVIIADDFTGALDTAVQFSKNSVDTAVVLYRDLKFERLDDGAQVIVVDTESRHVSRQEAEARVRAVSVQARWHGATCFYKKTDSVLRGNVGSELNALMDGADSEEIMFIPAYPDAKRTTVDGVQLVDGVPVAQTGFARDPLDPVHHSFIPDALRSQADFCIELVGREGPLPPGRGKTVYVFDAQDNGDLLRIALRLRKEGRLRVTAGCAGFANTLLEVLDLARNGKPAETPDYRNMLAVCGSINELSVRQARYAGEHGFCGVTLSPRQKLEADYFDTEEGELLTDRIAGLLKAGRNVVIKTVDAAGDEKECRTCAEAMGVAGGSVPFLITRNMAKFVARIAAKKRPDTLTVFGGDTTVGIAEALGFDAVLPKAEILTGVVLSQTLGAERSVNLVTKSGGFGDEDVLVRIHDRLSAMSAGRRPARQTKG